MTSETSVKKLAIFNSVVKMFTTPLTFFLAVHFVNIGLPGAQIGIIFAIGTLTSLLTILPSGFSNDRFKSKTLIAIALLLPGIQYFGLAMTHDFPKIVGLFLIGGIGLNLYTSSADSLFYKSTEKQHVSKKIGLYQSLNYAMIGLGIITAGYFLQLDITFEKIFLAVSIAFLAMCVISHFILPESETTKLEFLKYKKDIFRTKVILFILIMFLFSIHYGAESTTYGLFLKETLGLNPLNMGLYMGLSIGLMPIMVILISKRAFNWKARYLLLTGLFISGTGHILMTVQNPLLSFAFRAYHEAGDAVLLFFLFYGITKLFDLKRIGGNAGIFTLTTTIGASFGAVIFGPMGQIYGYNIPLIISGITSLLAFAIAAPFIHYFDHT